jgi:hypothetical protein
MSNDRNTSPSRENEAHSDLWLRAQAFTSQEDDAIRFLWVREKRVERPKIGFQVPSPGRDTESDEALIHIDARRRALKVLREAQAGKYDDGPKGPRPNFVPKSPSRTPVLIGEGMVLKIFGARGFATYPAAKPGFFKNAALRVGKMGGNMEDHASAGDADALSLKFWRGDIAKTVSHWNMRTSDRPLAHWKMAERVVKEFVVDIVRRKLEYASWNSPVCLRAKLDVQVGGKEVSNG